MINYVSLHISVLAMIALRTNPVALSLRCTERVEVSKRGFFLLGNEFSEKAWISELVLS